MLKTLSPSSQERLTPLEQFVRDYVEITGGVWEEVEPQVYDVLLPADDETAQRDAGGREILRMAFDPEALPEHAAAQLAGFGTPLVDRLLSGAVRRGRYALVYLNGLNLSPYDLTARVRRALTLPDDASLEFGRMRPLDFAQAVFWFEATFVSDQKEDEILSAAVDLHSGRQVRHLDQLLGSSQLAEEPSLHLAEARRQSVAAAYPAARQEVLRTLGALANASPARVERPARAPGGTDGPLLRRPARRAGRTGRRAVERGDDLAKFADRRKSLDREEQFRVAELRQKSAAARPPETDPALGRAATESVDPGTGRLLAEIGGDARTRTGVGPADGDLGSRILSEVRYPDDGLRVRPAQPPGVPTCAAGSALSAGPARRAK